jgi:hypothetical protein
MGYAIYPLPRSDKGAKFERSRRGFNCGDTNDIAFIPAFLKGFYVELLPIIWNSLG